MKFLVVATPSKRALDNGCRWTRQVSGPFEKPEAERLAKEQRERRVYGRVFLEKVTVGWRLA